MVNNTMKARALVLMLCIGMIFSTGFANTSDLTTNSDTNMVTFNESAAISTAFKSETGGVGIQTYYNSCYYLFYPSPLISLINDVGKINANCDKNINNKARDGLTA